MQAVILAGGKGTRLRPITYQIPKPMVPIYDKPFLQHQMELVKSYGFKDVLILAGYLGHKIEEYFENGSKLGLKIKYSYENAPLGTAGALKNAERKIMDDFLLLNGDTLLPIDYSKLAKYFLTNGKIGVIAVSSHPNHSSTNNIAIDSSNLIVGYNKKDFKNMSHKDAGASIFKKSILDIIPHGKMYSLEEDIYCGLIHRKELAAYVTNVRIYDMGTPQGLKDIEGVLK